jgi:hypothetical protein
MSNDNSFRSRWIKLNEIAKALIIFIISLIIFLIYTQLINGNNTTTSDASNGLGLTFNENGTPIILDTKGNPLNLVQCTEEKEKEKKQCAIYGEKFITESNLTINILSARKPGSTKCCITVFYGGEVSQDCVTYPVTLPRCPKPGQVLVTN